MKYALTALCAVAAVVGNTPLVFITLFAALAVEALSRLLERRKQAEAITLATLEAERSREAASTPSDSVIERVTALVERVTALETRVSGLLLKGAYEKSTR